MTEAIEIFVPGKPRTAGSKSGYLDKITGKIKITPAGKYQKPWMDSVKWAAIQAGYTGKMILDTPIHLKLQFLFIRPKTHYKKNGELTKSARRYCTARPDLTKLTRAVEDALTGLIWRDDSQVIRQTTGKDYGTPEGVYIRIEEIEEQIQTADTPMELFESKE